MLGSVVGIEQQYTKLAQIPDVMELTSKQVTLNKHIMCIKYRGLGTKVSLDFLALAVEWSCD